MTTVCCVFVRGEYPYTADYVVRLEQMVRRWIDRPYGFVCLTDQPELLPGIETIDVHTTWPEYNHAYWTKLEVFNPAREWPGRVLYLDLDVLLVAPLAPILDYPAPFALIDDLPRVAKKSVDSAGRAIVKRFNSSVMVWDGGTRRSGLYSGWNHTEADRLSGDQDWIGEQAPDAAAMPYAWFPRLSLVGPPPFAPEVKVILSKHPKNHLAADLFDWFGPLWGAA